MTIVVAERKLVEGAELARRLAESEVLDALRVGFPATDAGASCPRTQREARRADNR